MLGIINSNLQLKLWIIITCSLAGIFSSAYGQNSPEFDDAVNNLEPYLEPVQSFSIFWIFLLLIIIGVTMACMFKMREDQETIMFSLSATIFSIILALVFTSPVQFDYQSVETSYVVTNQTISINDLGGGTQEIINAKLTKELIQTIIIPNDQGFRFMMSLFFTGLSLFNGLYSIFIITNFHQKQLDKWKK